MLPIAWLGCIIKNYNLIMDFYDQLTDQYDVIFPHQLQKEKFIAQQLLNEDSKILDVGCATGSMAIALSARGYSLSAIDMNEKMITIAGKKAEEKQADVDFRMMNMLHISQNFKRDDFNLVYCIGNTLPHLPDKESITQFLSQVYYLLKPSGKILIQMVNFDKMLKNMIRYFPAVEKDEFIFKREYDYVEDYINFKAEIEDKSTGKIYSASTTLLPVSAHEIKKIASEVSFKDIQLFGDFSGTSYDLNSPAIILLANK